MLAVNRTPNESDRAKKPMISNAIMNGTNANGKLGGKNMSKNRSWCLIRPVIVTLMNNARLVPNVNATWLVAVIEYGIIPLRLIAEINKKNVKKSGTYTLLLKALVQLYATFGSKNSLTVECIISIIACHAVGTIVSNDRLKRVMQLVAPMIANKTNTLLETVNPGTNLKYVVPDAQMEAR